MPNDDLNRTDSVQSRIGFGYIGIELCEACSSPKHVFVASHRPNVSIQCVECWSSHFYFSDTTQVLIPTPEIYPILIDPTIALCAGCVSPLLPSDTGIWGTTTALLRDLTEVKVHARCLHDETCETCDTKFASVHRRSYRSLRNRTDSVQVLESSRFTYFVRVEGNHYCESCANTYMDDNGGSDNYIECEACEDNVHNTNTGWFAGTRYCDNCIENHVFSCDNCNEDRWEDDDHDCEESSDDDNDSSLIHSYSYRPSPFFFGEGKYHFGFELEVEARGNGRYDGALLVHNTLGGHAYLKEDASLNEGFEIVTHPHTLEKYHTDFNWEVLDKLKREGYRSWNTSTCGIHVHVSRTAFGNGDPWDFQVSNSKRSQLLLQRQSHELRFMKLVYDNQRQVERISGRSSDRYASFQDKGQLSRKVKYGYQENGRFSAINTENDATIEVRVFKGSLRKERVLSAIEFVHASVEYTRDMKVTSKNHALSWLKFTGYVSANAETYPNLVTIMSESFANDSSVSDDE